MFTLRLWYSVTCHEIPPILKYHIPGRRSYIELVTKDHLFWEDIFMGKWSSLSKTGSTVTPCELWSLRIQGMSRYRNLSLWCQTGGVQAHNLTVESLVESPGPEPQDQQSSLSIAKRDWLSWCLFRWLCNIIRLSLHFRTTHGTKKIWSYIASGLKMMLI